MYFIWFCFAIFQHIFPKRHSNLIYKQTDLKSSMDAFTAFWTSFSILRICWRIDSYQFNRSWCCYWVIGSVKCQLILSKLLTWLIYILYNISFNRYTQYAPSDPNRVETFERFCIWIESRWCWFYAIISAVTTITWCLHDIEEYHVEFRLTID